MRRPNKPHRDGFEDEEDCVGYYDPDDAERRGCATCQDFDHRVSDTSDMTGRQCYESWKVEEDARLQALENAKTPEEKAQYQTFIEGLRKLY